VIALFLLFSKELQKERLLFCSFKRAMKIAIALLLFQKERKSKNEQKFSKSLIFRSKKERSLIFKMRECPTLVIT